MNPKPLPPGARNLEDLLAHRPGPEPAADFRARILSALAASSSDGVSARPGPAWRLVWQAAAAVVLALNLAMCVANGQRYQRLVAAAPGDAAPAPARAEMFAAQDRLDALAAGALRS